MVAQCLHTQTLIGLPPYSHTDLFTKVAERGEGAVAVTHAVLTNRAGVLTPLTQVGVDVCKGQDWDT